MSTSTGSKFVLADRYARFVAFKVEDLFSKKRVPGPARTVFVNEQLPDDYINHKQKVKPEHVYTTNQVITSKYTLITFLPRNLLEQFRRIANIYFLFISILQFFRPFSTISPGVVLLPLLVILALTAIKDGYEDIKRHQADRRVNYSTVRVLSGGWKNPNITVKKHTSLLRHLLPHQYSAAGVLLPSKRASKRRSDVEGEVAPHHDPEVEFDYDLGEESSEELDRPHWKPTYSEDVRVGDFVKIMDNEAFPADILICATSEDDNVAFVETKNLDGETNLKSRHAVQALTELRNAKECANTDNAFHIRCDRPEVDMYRLNATVSINGDEYPVDSTMTLLRGTVLRNTGWVIGIVLFTGLDTKIVLNSGGTPSKQSKVERQMNPQVIINLCILALMAVVCAIADSTLEKHYFPLGAPWLYGDDHKGDNPRMNGLITWTYSLLTFQAVVPISLYISIEFVRTCQAAFIHLDADIWCEKTDQATIARSWNLSDDLGQIEYIFSDKTGTLTQNSMVFRRCTIGGHAYRGDNPEATLNEKNESPPQFTEDLPVEDSEEITHFKDSVLTRDLEDAVSADPNTEYAPHARNLNAFFTVLALCHTVLTGVDPVTGKIEYKAQSPDEAALVQAAADVGFVFLGRDRETMSLRTPSSTEVEKYELLNILEFTSSRKRMSVVLRKMGDELGRLFLLTKGADNVIFERLKAGADELKEETEKHLSEFANEGLRTLTLAYKVISEDEYASWNERYHEATVSQGDREGRVEAVSNELEQDLRLLGATAIEDRLQDGVPETIADLKRAGIKIWVATGDKLETAIAIGRSTNLVSPDSNIIIVRGGKRPVHEQMLMSIEQFFPEVEAELPSRADETPRRSTSSHDSERRIPLQRINTGVSSIVGSANGDRPGGFVLVVDGGALLQVFAEEESKALLLKLAMLCEGVICCRVSPLQKALVVKLVKDGLGTMTLAIGDGANDVSMIQAADIGVGIAGQEGLQAVNSSDYAIAQFRFLKKLLLVHGHWSYARNGTMIMNFFYKNIVPVGVLWWFQIYAGWSGTFVMDYTYILFWNSVWTIAPVIGIGLFDRVLDSHILMELPEVYHYGRRGTWFGLTSFFIYMLDGVVQSVIIYFIIVYAYRAPTMRKDGYGTYLYEWSTTMAIASVMVSNIFTGFSATAWTAWLFFAVFIGIIIVWVYTAIYSIVSPSYSVTHLFGNDHFLFQSASFWFCILLTLFVSLAPRYLYKAWKFTYNPDDIDMLRWIQRLDKHTDFSKYSSVRGSKAPELVALMRGGGASRTSRASSFVSAAAADRERPGMGLGQREGGSKRDMSTGLVSVDRGFDFAAEERGVHMRRVQTNLSEKRASRRCLGVGGSGSGEGEREKGRESGREKGKEGKEGGFGSFGRRLKRLRKVSSGNLKGHGHKD